MFELTGINLYLLESRRVNFCHSWVFVGLFAGVCVETEASPADNHETVTGARPASREDLY